MFLSLIIDAGPFWITTTTILILFFSSTLAGYLAAVHTNHGYSYDFTLLTSAAGLMYGYAAIVPAVLWGAMKWYGCEPSLLEIICLYGYGGMIVWIPVVCIPMNTTKTVPSCGDYTDILVVNDY